MSFSRTSGILLHPTSLPGRFGIGTLGEDAYRFADFLVGAGQRIWAILPLVPTGYGNSPYQSPSTFAGNPLLISLEGLVDENLLEAEVLRSAPFFPSHRVEYDRVAQFKMPLLASSFEIFDARADSSQKEEYQNFCQQNEWWLHDYALFMAVRKAHNQHPWTAWEEGIKLRRPEALEHWRKKLAREIQSQKYVQFQFSKQWRSLKTYCNDKGVQILGDMPFYVALDSADVWSHQEMFYLDATGNPTIVAGVPPDYFSETGQLWGNPLYRWEAMAQDGYVWWKRRLRATLEIVDIVRLDHFRGFEKYWEIPSNEATAVKGRWVPGPGAAFFEAVQRELELLPIIAEDLGLITPEVHALRDRFGFPGMRVLQFAFAGDGNENAHLPINHSPNCVVYTGTHDNDTVLGWFGGGSQDTTLSKEALDKEREHALKYVGTPCEEINWDFIRLALASKANTAIVPLQDLLGLGSEARMNRPGVATGNWEWRFASRMLTDGIKDRLRELTQFCRR
ncbi:MAG: 4-alpha-glucanotransferase [Chloroflexi bacterium]|nr:4-alpha-glucanotransferase [Chloroflexota bacterium]